MTSPDDPAMAGDPAIAGDPAGDGPAPSAATGPGAPPACAAGGPAAGVSPPVLPEQSPEDTDAAWGEYPDRPDDRLLRDRPPHWNDF